MLGVQRGIGFRFFPKVHDRVGKRPLQCSVVSSVRVVQVSAVHSPRYVRGVEWGQRRLPGSNAQVKA